MTPTLAYLLGLVTLPGMVLGIGAALYVGDRVAGWWRQPVRRWSMEARLTGKALANASICRERSGFTRLVASEVARSEKLRGAAHAWRRDALTFRGDARRWARWCPWWPSPRLEWA